ncbi:MAG: NAD(P)H-dependent oxidoreductase [Mesorhizobium sp.]|uniref:NADPH-dependent FMN reductase n=1 Tax=unclassified Mesorhizobium TaxID=325217 RepID=UPI000FCCACBC|nr:MULTISPECIES: NAD(P)H-dependent oxidoreductase [unclassified Mesorhizobium]RUV67581.1 NAD(P)H-dependent oxidoreductase [Mesorhizobium sp. M5C.F.Cr.IN.023.01.1.1]RWF88257.1 MAG: NAD(P)H-dependent oxidoreductase [Mesorhizobium sp.]RWF93123.1 MAG: NAD(P)H-dependent oxidoreductase [Mesorhizobium sp.]RWI42374.1 MAG: NAD(P)H-dependent oxidoreductase [Mesorhizobium sp.]RWI53558.1 MAG: NAD(P)H-dependent oxidoreductase [Mesorhizobium sp.]
MPHKIAVLVGSLRTGSLNRKVAELLVRISPNDLSLEIVGIGDLPLYNEDLDENAPREWQAFRERIKASDAILFVTPEYNRSVPGALKNAIDVGSRPYGASVWDGKPGGVITASPGAIGGFGANHHLRQMFVFLNVLVMQQPEAYLSHASEMFDESGALVHERSREFLTSFLDAYAKWVTKCLSHADLDQKRLSLPTTRFRVSA